MLQETLTAVRMVVPSQTNYLPVPGLTEIPSLQLKKCNLYKVSGEKHDQHLLCACFVHMTVLKA